MPDATQGKIARLSELQCEPVDWLWPGRLAAGKLTVLDGDPGQGKSLLTLDLAARFTTARPFPDDYQPDTRCSVVLLAGEDGIADTILPRLRAAGADLDRVHQLQSRSAAGWDQLPTFPDDTCLLRDTIQQTGARLVIVDPLLAFLSTRVSSTNDQLIRQAFNPLGQVAQETRSSIVLVRHLTKAGSRQRALYRGSGAVGIIGAARTAFLAGTHPNDPDLHLLACIKNNLAALPPTLAYRVVTDALGYPAIDWTGSVPLTADDLVLAPARAPVDALSHAVEFLSELLEPGPCRREHVLRQARAGAISDRTLERAKKQLHIVSEQKGEAGKNVWYWRHPNPEETSQILADLWTNGSGTEECLMTNDE